jgi:hypothetical protein
MYVFDTSSLRVLRNYYPHRFLHLWEHVEAAVASGVVKSVRECRRELLEQVTEKWLVDWVKRNTQIFLPPTPAETAFVARIFAVPHFQALVSEKQRLQGKPVADPFVIACAASREWSVVTQEQHKPHASKIPNVCEHFGVRCTDLEGFMRENNWTF